MKPSNFTSRTTKNSKSNALTLPPRPSAGQNEQRDEETDEDEQKEEENQPKSPSAHATLLKPLSRTYAAIPARPASSYLRGSALNL